MNTDKLLKDPIFFKIVRFFNENPSSIDTPRGIAAWTGEDRGTIKKALDKLVDLKILVAHKVSTTTGYSYTDNPAMIKKINLTLKKLDAGR